MLSSYRVECPHAGCDWSGSLVPSVVQDIEAGNGAQGFFLGTTALAAGLLNAACMS